MNEKKFFLEASEKQLTEDNFFCEKNLAKTCCKMNFWI